MVPRWVSPLLQSPPGAEIFVGRNIVAERRELPYDKGVGSGRLRPLRLGGKHGCFSFGWRAPCPRWVFPKESERTEALILQELAHSDEFITQGRTRVLAHFAWRSGARIPSLHPELGICRRAVSSTASFHSGFPLKCAAGREMRPKWLRFPTGWLRAVCDPSAAAPTPPCPSPTSR